MEDQKDFEKFEKRLNSLNEDIRSRALEYAAEIFAEEEITREEALEKAISKAELEKRNL